MEAMEVLLGADDKNVLKLLINGFDNTSITQNNNLSLISFMKISNEPTTHIYLINILKNK